MKCPFNFHSKLTIYTEFCPYASPSHSTEAVFANTMILGCKDGAVVRVLASHQCEPGSIPSSGVKCGLSLLVLCSA